MTASFPETSALLRHVSMHPAGVHAIAEDLRHGGTDCQYCHENPSTSFSTAIFFCTSASEMCSGRGSCTRMCTLASSFSCEMVAPTPPASQSLRAKYQRRSRLPLQLFSSYAYVAELTLAHEHHSKARHDPALSQRLRLAFISARIVFAMLFPSMIFACCSSSTAFIAIFLCLCESCVSGGLVAPLFFRLDGLN